MNHAAGAGLLAHLLTSSLARYHCAMETDFPVSHSVAVAVNVGQGSEETEYTDGINLYLSNA